MSSYASSFRDRREGRYMKTVSYKDPYEPLSVVIQIDDDDEEGLRNGVHETTEYLELFLRNLLLDEKNELHNRSMHISGMSEEADIESAKADIESAEADIENQKADIRNRLLFFSDMISEKTIDHALELFSKCGKKEYFGRTIVEDITGLKSTRASELIKLLVDSEIIVPVTGHGKGKYRFQ